MPSFVAGFNTPGSIIMDENPSVSVSNLEHMKLDDGTYCTFSRSGTIDVFFDISSFGFSIPASATSIDGIEVVTDIYKGNNNSPSQSQTLYLELDGGGVQTGNEKTLSGLGTTPGVQYTFGGPTDTWGTTPSVSQINSSNFTVRYNARQTDPDVTGISTLIDTVKVKIYYTAPAEAPSTVSLNRRNSISIPFGF